MNDSTAEDLTPLDAPGDAPVLVAVVNNPDDLERARREGWYRIPLRRAPARIGADFVAFYLTGAFSADERWAVRWVAPVRGYRVSTRVELIPEEPAHARARERYYRIDIGTLWPLARPIPSRRLRRITFIRTTLERLLEAEEINDLWMQTPARERLWSAIQEAGLADAVERDYPIVDDLPYVADFAVFGEGQCVAVIVTENPRDLDDCIRERAGLDYPLVAGEWRSVIADPENPGWIEPCLAEIRAVRSNPAI